MEQRSDEPVKPRVSGVKRLQLGPRAEMCHAQWIGTALGQPRRKASRCKRQQHDRGSEATPHHFRGKHDKKNFGKVAKCMHARRMIKRSP